MYMWGEGTACGQRTGDVLWPTKVTLRYRAVQVAAGRTHSVALTGRWSSAGCKPPLCNIISHTVYIIRPLHLLC